MKLKRTLFTIIIPALLLILGHSYAQDEAVLRVGIITPVILDPALATNDSEFLINRHLYDFLIDLTPSGELVPSLAESWFISDDRRSYVLQLVDNATFHDGQPLTAADVVYTFERLVEVGAPAVDIMGTSIIGTDDEGNPIEEPRWRVQALNDSTVEFILDAPNSDFLFGLSARSAAIIPEGETEPNMLDSDGNLSNVNGTGAFILDSYNENGARLIVNPNYWRGQSELDTLEFVFIDEQEEQIQALADDDIDFIFKVPEGALPRLQFNPDITVISVDTNIHPVIRLRSDAGHIGEDVRVRQAFKHATDRELLNVLTLNGLGNTGNNDPIGPLFSDFYRPIDDLAYDPDLACDLLATYASDNPDNPWVSLTNGQPRLEVDFYVVQAFEYPQLAEYAAEQWEDGCIYVNIILRPENIYYGNDEYLEVELGLTGWSNRPTAQEYLELAYVEGAPFNETHWSNPLLDALVAQARQALSNEERIAIYDDVRQIFVNEGPIIIPYFAPLHGAYRNHVQGIDMHPFPGRTNFYSVTVE